MATVTAPKTKLRVYPLLTPKERILIWEKARGMWKNRIPDPTRELRKIRKGWERKLP